MIRETTSADRDTLRAIHRAAFEQEDEADLTCALLDDPTARPVVSLLHEAGGHVLFTQVTAPSAVAELSAHILCPLAVRPEAQGKGVGTALVRKGLEDLREKGCDLVLVLGDPVYYGRFGFCAVGTRGFDAPFPLSRDYLAGWQMMDLSSDGNLRGTGRITCADTLMQEKYWID